MTPAVLPRPRIEVALQPVMVNAPALFQAVSVKRLPCGAGQNGHGKPFVTQFAWWMLERRAALARKGIRT